MNRACLEARCPRFAVPGGRGRCAVHRRTTSQRSYGPFHQRERQRLAASLPAPCGYCGRVIQRGERFDAAHWDDREPYSPRFAAHPLCNQQAKDGMLRPIIPLEGR